MTWARFRGSAVHRCSGYRTLSAVALPCRNMKMWLDLARLPLGGGELTTGSVDLLAPGVPDGHRHPVSRDRLDERLLVLGPRGGPLRTRCRVQRDEVDVHG